MILKNFETGGKLFRTVGDFCSCRGCKCSFNIPYLWPAFDTRQSKKLPHILFSMTKSRRLVWPIMTFFLLLPGRKLQDINVTKNIRVCFSPPFTSTPWIIQPKYSLNKRIILTPWRPPHRTGFNEERKYISFMAQIWMNIICLVIIIIIIINRVNKMNNAVQSLVCKT